MSGIVGSRLNIRGSGIVGGIGTDGQVLTSSGAGQEMVFEDAGGGAVTAINNATQSELVSIGSTTTELDAEANLTFTGSALTCIGTITVGVDNTGHDVKFFGATSGKYFEWDESGNQVNVVGNTLLKGNFTVGVDDTGHDVKFYGATASTYVMWDESIDALKFSDDTGLVLGSDDDFFLGPYAPDEQGLQLNLGTSSANGGANNTYHLWWGMKATVVTYYELKAPEGAAAGIIWANDESDDNDDRWLVGGWGTSFTPSTRFTWIDKDSGSYDAEMGLTLDGVLTTEGAMNASTSVDYAEFFEWDTELASDQAVKDTYGLSVVLVNDKVRLAVEGEEADVLGVVRPNDVSACIGGTQTFMWKDRWLRDVWGEKIKEQYTLCKWYDLNDDGTRGKYYEVMKDRIPPYKLKGYKIDINSDLELNQSEHNWHLDESNYIRDESGNFIPLVVPSTDEQKAAQEYTERNTYRRDKGEDGKRIGDPLMRNVINPDYVSAQDYIPRNKRRREWCIVGLLGQVPVRDTAIISPNWNLMRNLESGINMYYIK